MNIYKYHLPEFSFIIYIYIYIYIYLYMYIYIYIYICMYVCMYACMHIFNYLLSFLSSCLFIYLFICLSMSQYLVYKSCRCVYIYRVTHKKKQEIWYSLFNYWKQETVVNRNIVKTEQKHKCLDMVFKMLSLGSCTMT